MAKQKVEIEVYVPEGWELTGEYRAPVTGEHFLWVSVADFAKPATCDFYESRYPILQPLPPSPPEEAT